MVEVHLSDRGISWEPALRLRRVTTRRALYGRDSVRVLLVVLWITAFLSAVILHRSGEIFQGPTALFGLGTALGGAGGNLLDILRRRGVTDFIDLGWWPAFNLADAAILGGLALAFWPGA